MNKKILFLPLVFLILFCCPVFAQDKIKVVLNINQKFELEDINQEILFTNEKEVFFRNIIIPENSVITTQSLQSQAERRWHKNGFIVLFAKGFETEDGRIVDLEQEEMYLIAQKYEKTDKKEAILTGTETVAATAASFVIPGADTAYYFTKGALQKKDSPNWFKSGVINVYNNSIFWLWFKGRPIELSPNDMVSLRETKKKKALKLVSKITKRKSKKRS